MSPPEVRRTRLRRHLVDVSRTRNGQCRVEVTLEWEGDQLFSGRSSGLDIPEGRVRAGAAATLDAAVAASRGARGEGVRLELRGIKTVRAFDELVVLLSLRAEGVEQRYDLIGSATAPGGDLVEGGVLAILDATNRIMERFVRREPSP